MPVVVARHPFDREKCVVEGGGGRLGCGLAEDVVETGRQTHRLPHCVDLLNGHLPRCRFGAECLVCDGRHVCVEHAGETAGLAHRQGYHGLADATGPDGVGKCEAVVCAAGREDHLDHIHVIAVKLTDQILHVACRRHAWRNEVLRQDQSSPPWLRSHDGINKRRRQPLFHVHKLHAAPHTLTQQRRHGRVVAVEPPALSSGPHRQHYRSARLAPDVEYLVRQGGRVGQQVHTQLQRVDVFGHVCEVDACRCEVWRCE
mmetsp:Transcript_12231/g.35466  ORF Transcript_12231/g.35466 Transcript_12231/m.35466 type:complete len:258 (-) Transcript_12231:1069-1842(-)